MLINSKDNVAIALKTLQPDEIVKVVVDGTSRSIMVKQNIPIGHKIALKKILPWQPVIKYGEIIGYSTVEIAEGEFVHVHNVVGRDEVK